MRGGTDNPKRTLCMATRYRQSLVFFHFIYTASQSLRLASLLFTIRTASSPAFAYYFFIQLFEVQVCNVHSLLMKTANAAYAKKTTI